MAGEPGPQDHQTVLTAEETGGLGELRIQHPPGTFALTPASHIALEAIGDHQRLLAGNGIDWGTGTGCLAIVAAKIGAVRRVVGLDISVQNVESARRNAALNGAAEKTAFFVADSYVPTSEPGRQALQSLRGCTDFILANPPSSDGDDGFSFRRLVLDGARQFLTPGGLIFLNISYQYGQARIDQLSRQFAGLQHNGVLASTDWVPFDLLRPDLLDCLVAYAAEEARGGASYAFIDPGVPGRSMDARTALAGFQRTGLSPLTRWQTHLFRFTG